MVVSKPKRARMCDGSVWKEGRVDKVVRRALAWAGEFSSDSGNRARQGTHLKMIPPVTMM
jgi:hypothetical protein